MQIPVGILSDRWGPRKVIILSSFIAALGAISFGLSPNFSVAIISRIFVGIGVSALFIAAGVFSLIPAVCSWFILADTPAKKGLPNIAEMPGVSKNTNMNIIKDLKMILREKHFWAIAIWFIFRGGALFGFFGLWAGPYLIETYRLSKYSAGNILSMIAFAMILLSPVLGHMSDKTLSSRKKVLVWTSVPNSICWLVMLVFFEQLSTAWLYVIFFIMGITISSVGTIAIVATKELFPPEIAGTSMGTMNVFPFIGGIIFQPLIGYMLDKTGKIQGVYPPSAYKSMIWLLFVISILALISIMFSKETIKRM